MGSAVLSDREKEVLRLLVMGHGAKSIANELGLSVHTVNDRLRESRRKLGVSSSREAARRLFEAESSGPKFVGRNELGHDDIVSVVTSSEERRTFKVDHRAAWLAGGMLVMSLVIASVALLSVAGAPTLFDRNSRSISTVSSSPAENDALAAARQWIALLDKEQWDATWSAAGATFRAQLTSQQWASTIQPVRRPLGRAGVRRLQSAVRANSLPGAPTGDYQVLQFQTSFANKHDAVETVVLSREQSVWRVSGYFIR